MILASDVFAGIRSVLDDDNSGRYTEADDLSPVVNLAINYLVQIFMVAFEQKRFAPENLRELIRVEIFPVLGTGNTKRANISSITDDILTIFGIEPDPEMGFLGATTTNSPEEFIGSRNRFAEKSTLNAWEDQASDPFSPGSLQQIPDSFVRSSYIGPAQFFSDGNQYILIRPSSIFVENNYVAVYYLHKPTAITDGGDFIELPDSLHNFIVEKALNLLSLQQDPSSKLGPVTKQEIEQLISLLI